MGRKPAAHMCFEPHQGAQRCARYVDYFDSIQYAQRSRIRGRARQFFQMRARDMLDVHRLEVRGAELQHPRPQQKVAPVAGDIAEFLERQQAAACGGSGDSGAAGNVAESQGRMIAGECPDDRQPLGQAAHRLAMR